MSGSLVGGAAKENWVGGDGQAQSGPRSTIEEIRVEMGRNC